MAFDPKGTEFYPWLSFTLIVFPPYCAIFKSFDWLKISRSSLQPRSKIKTKTGFDMCAHFTSLFLCFFFTVSDLLIGLFVPGRCDWAW